MSFLFPPAIYETSSFSSQHHQHLILSVYIFSFFSYSNRSVIISDSGFNLHFLVTNVEHLFLCLFAICIYSLMTCLLKSFAYFLIGLFVFLLLSSERFLYILCVSHMSARRFAKAFSKSVACLFISL